MRCQRRLTIAALTALAAVMATGRSSERVVPKMELADVVGHAVCPLKVVVDEDPLRIPRRIKFLKCDREDPQRCPASAAGAPRSCCATLSRLPAYMTECVEVFDNVVVQFLSHEGADAANATLHVVQVPVGCTCVMRTGTIALEDN